MKPKDQGTDWENEVAVALAGARLPAKGKNDEGDVIVSIMSWEAAPVVTALAWRRIEKRKPGAKRRKLLGKFALMHWNDFVTLTLAAKYGNPLSGILIECKSAQDVAWMKELREIREKSERRQKDDG